jgi:hypothetical protein
MSNNTLLYHSYKSPEVENSNSQDYMDRMR